MFAFSVYLATSPQTAAPYDKQFLVKTASIPYTRPRD